MANRPTTPRGWAEQAPSDKLEDPVAERPEGFDKGEFLPNTQMNEILQQLYRWVDYFDDLFDRQGLIDLYDHVRAGLGDGYEGEFLIGTQASNFGEPHVVFEAEGSAGLVATWEADTVAADQLAVAEGSGPMTLYDGPNRTGYGALELDGLRQHSGGEPIQFQDDSGTDGEGGASLSYLREGSSDDPIRLQNNAGTNDVGGLALGYLKEGPNSSIDVQDAQGNSGEGRLEVSELQPGVADETVAVLNSTGDEGEGNLRVSRIVSGINSSPVVQFDGDPNDAQPANGAVQAYSLRESPNSEEVFVETDAGADPGEGSVRAKNVTATCGQLISASGSASFTQSGSCYNMGSVQTAQLGDGEYYYNTGLSVPDATYAEANSVLAQPVNQIMLGESSAIWWVVRAKFIYDFNNNGQAWVQFNLYKFDFSAGTITTEDAPSDREFRINFAGWLTTNTYATV